ncbi:MAG: outer membrane beta-barrel domain-containing protein [Kangiellaceae bacterium]|jgi:outer membrane beta-barrel protein|nr:outer membrane beta-barrel domain-containing protein [Kangiellaceae bacterium]
MVNRIQRIFLVASFCYLYGVSAIAAENTNTAEQNSTEQTDKTSPKNVYEPKIERQTIEEALIDDEDFELGLFFGILNIEDFGSTELSGARFAYHVNEDFFININYATATAGLTSDEELFNIIRFTADQRNYEYYDFSVAWNVLPGEAFFTDESTVNTSFYLVAGIGNTEFAGNTEYTYIVGAGYKILYNDWLAINLDTRDHMFNTDLNGSSKRVHNIEFSVGLSVFF